MSTSVRELFPHMPDDVFDIWLAPHIAFSGWPFLSGNETMVADSTWAKYLRNLGPHFWAGVRWRRVKSVLTAIPLEERAKNVAGMLAEVGRQFIESGITPPTLIVKDSHLKVAALAGVLNASGQFPKPLICLVQGSEWWLMDGHHRLGAAFYLGVQNSIPFDAWLGSNAA